LKPLTIFKLTVLSVILAVPGFSKVWISEIVADNDGSHLDEDGDDRDWIELFNDASTSIDLSGWSLTDDDADLRKWIFPPGTTISSQDYLIVWASGKNRRVAGGEFHTSFSLKRSGEYLGLIRADGSTVEDEYAPKFPGQFSGASYGVSQTDGSMGYYTSVTPGAVNGASLAAVPPFIRDVTETPDRPMGGPGSAPILITAEVQEGTDGISQVRLFHRSMFGPEASLQMRDNGSGGDEVAGDGLFSVRLPTTGLSAGEMLRWRVEASDSASGVSLSPAFLDPSDADRYYGTVALNPAHASSQLTIMETFVEDEVAVDTELGTTASIYYLGNFYDNVQMDRHGQSTAAFPKKSYDLDFNKGNRFLWKDGEERVKDTNLLTNWADKSKVRNTMGYEMLRRSGSPSHYALPIRMERNGDFFSITDLVEDGDDRFLDRVGLDREGTLYKMYDRIEDASTAVKKSRKELGTSDLQALIAGLDENLPRNVRREYAYDNVDIAATVNHLAAYLIAGISDTGHKNFYLYRDTEGDGEWNPLPWDVDLSAGRRWNPTDFYFDDSFFSNLWISNPNRLWELIHNTPEFRDMILRRIQTLRKEVLLSPADAAAGPDWYTEMVQGLRDQIDPSGIVSDSDLDYDKWGSWGNNDRSRTATARLLINWLPQKRSYLFSSARQYQGDSIPADQVPLPPVTIEAVEFLPVSGDQDEEYLIIKNNGSVSVDLSGFTLSGGVEFTFPPGTVIPAGSGTAGSDFIGTLHLAKNAKAFRARNSGPTSGEYRFIQGGYRGQFSARGETTELRNADAALVDSFSYTGSPTLAQQGLRVTEINYHPGDASAAEEAALPGVTSEDFEFVELKNTSGATLDLSGAQFTEGIVYTFAAGTSLPAGARLLLVKNPSAFAVRYPNVTASVYGPYLGLLSNDGDTLRLVDKVGENILVFTYNDRWYPPSDGGGQSLVLAGDETLHDGLDSPSAWGLSTSLNGSPGSGDATVSTHFNAWQEANFAPSAWDDPLMGTADADPDGDGLENWEEYAFGTQPLVPDSALFQGEVVTQGGGTYLGAKARRRTNAADLVWQLQRGNNLSGWTNQAASLVSATGHADGTETVLLREANPVGASPKRFVRLLLTHQP